MDVHAARTLTSQLSEDLAWLEQHARHEPDQEESAARLRIAASLVRNCIGPMLDGQNPPPLHIVVVGGAGAGKSTVSNMLSGAVVAEANPQAGFTRHPIAYLGTNASLTWTHHAGFLGPLSRLSDPAPSSVDQDVYQIRRVPGDPNNLDLLKTFVVWDCPDMTTWAAGGYVPRLLEAAGLADVLVYVASDERYNDEVPTRYLRLLLETGKPVICCLLKMQEKDAPALVAHFQAQVLEQLPSGVVATIPIPSLTREQLADPIRLAARYRIPLVNQVSVLADPVQARRRTVIGAMRYLLPPNQEKLFAFVRRDLDALKTWDRMVAEGRAEFDNRYVKEYLTTEKFRGFDEALIKLLELLELPGIGWLIGGALKAFAWPFQWLVGKFSNRGRPDAAGRPEEPVLREALDGWLDSLRKEMARQANTHPLYDLVNKGFQSGGLAEKVKERFNASFKTFQAGLHLEVDRAARAIYEDLEKNPIMLNTLRGSKFLLDALAVGGTIVTAGGLVWQSAVAVPIVCAVTKSLVDLMGKNFVDGHREATRQRQLQLMKESLSVPLGEVLTRWPTTGGSAYERLQQALTRIPANLDVMYRMLHECLQRQAPPPPVEGELPIAALPLNADG